VVFVEEDKYGTAQNTQAHLIGYHPA